MMKNTQNSLLVGLFLVVIVVLNMSMFIISQSLDTGYIDHYYQRNLDEMKYPEVSDEHFELRWPDQLYVHTDNDIVLHAHQVDGQVIDITSAQVHFYRPDDAQQDVDADLSPVGDETYVSTVNFSSPGLWHMHMLLTYQGQQHLLDYEFVVVRQRLSLPQRTYSLGPKKEKEVESWSSFFIRMLLGRAKDDVG